jgi:hypothetical protein
MNNPKQTLLTAALCLGAIVVLTTAGTAQAQTRSANTYNVLKQHVSEHVRMIRKIENNRDYAILPKVLDRLENLVIIVTRSPVPDPGPKRKVGIIHPHFIIVTESVINPYYVIWPDFIIDPYYVVWPDFIIGPCFVLADLHATAVMRGDMKLVDDLEYLARVMAVVDR